MTKRQTQDQTSSRSSHQQPEKLPQSKAIQKPKSKLMQLMTQKFQEFKKTLNEQILTVYRDCKDICHAIERGDSDLHSS